MYRKLVLLVSFVLVLGLVNTARANLVAYYEFENNADDSVGSKHGTASGDPTYAAAVYDLGIDMDGDGDYVTVTDGGATEFADGNFSIAFWMKTPDDFNFYHPDDPNRNLRQVFINGTKGTGHPATLGEYTEPRYEFYYDTWAVPYFWIGDGFEFDYPANFQVCTHRDFYTGDWTHVTVVRDREPIPPELRLYLNGLEVEEPIEDATYDITSTGEPLYIGAAPAAVNEPNINGMDPNAWFRGMLDDLRFYDHVLTDDEIVKLARPDWMVATNPSPRNKERAVDVNADLSWLAGDDANGHDVYFGTVFNDVNTATRASDPCGVLVSTNQAGASYPLSTLSKNKTYYWRIDEVNDSNVAQWPGELWSFTIRGTPLVEPNLIGWWRFDGDGNDYSGYGSHGTLCGNASYGSGKFGGGLQLTEDLEDGDMDDYFDCGNGTIFDLRENFTLMAWILKPTGQGRKSGGIVTKGANAWDFVGEATDTIKLHCRGLTDDSIKSHWDYNYIGEWRHVAAVYDGSEINIYVMGEPDDPDISTGLVNINKDKVYIGAYVSRRGRHWPGRIDDVRIYNRVLSEGQIQAIMNDPGYPVSYGPYPADGSTWAKDPNGDLVLAWSACGADSYDVYFGANEVNVTEANDIWPCYRGNTVSKTFDIGAEETFDFEETYYWRIDVVNEPNTTKGSVWHFTVADYLLIDDFESYYSGPHLRGVWDGHASYVQLNETESHEGEQSMRFIYYNLIGFMSYLEANNTYGTAQDWTTEDVKALTLYFLGTDSDNGPDRLYVELVDNEGHAAMVKHSDVNAIIEPVVWQEWNIDLQDFKYPAQTSANDVNLANIRSVVIGIGNRDGPASDSTGEVSFDDIRLHLSRCVPEYGPSADLTGDCSVDFEDVNAMQRDWLNTTSAPNDSNLLGYWQLNGNGDDSSGNGNSGTRVGDTVYGVGKSGKALGLYGDQDYMTVGNDTSFNITGPFTVSAWIRRSGDGGKKSQTIVAKGGSSWRLYTRSQSENIEFACDGLDVPNPEEGEDPIGVVKGDLDVEDNEWHHVAGVYDGSNIYVYGDGVPEVLDINDACTPDTDSNAVWFGQNYEYDADSEDYREWEGYIDEVRIYDYALSEAEIDYLAELPTDLTNDDKVNFQDYAEVGKAWLEKQEWP